MVIFVLVVLCVSIEGFDGATNNLRQHILHSFAVFASLTTSLTLYFHVLVVLHHRHFHHLGQAILGAAPPLLPVRSYGETRGLVDMDPLLVGVREWRVGA